MNEPAAAPPVLELDRLTVRYGGVTAVRELSIEVTRGEIVGLIGPNGAGKSTTLYAIMGAVPVDDGDVRLSGRSVRGRAPEAIARSGVALVPEGRRIFGELTVEENLRLGLSGRRGREGGEEAMEEVYGLFPVVREFGRRQAGALSGGQQQQLAIGRALVAGPDLLLLDEPSLGLAPGVVDVVFDALAEIRRRGITVLLVEQRAQRTVDSPTGRICGEWRGAVDARPGGRRRHGGDGARLPLVSGALVASLDAQTIVDAVGLGAVYALMAVGIGLVFGVLRLVNFAYGEVCVMAGAYMLAFTSQADWPTWAGIATRFVVVVVLSALMDRLVLRRSGPSRPP